MDNLPFIILDYDYSIFNITILDGLTVAITKIPLIIFHKNLK